jgi:hydrogenase/urease accessory protein HupE
MRPRRPSLGPRGVAGAALGTLGLVPLLLLALHAGVLPARAHGLEPALLALRETQPGSYAVTWKSSKLRLPGANVVPRLPARCREASRAEAIDAGDRIELRWSIDCGARGLAGETVGVDGLEVARITALLLVERRDGSVTQSVLNARTPSIVVAVQPGAWDVLRDYAVLGVEHILGGPDHLLFVLGLLLLVPTTRLLVETVTAFTIGHSITLSAAVLGVATVPSRPVEVLIAASVLLLAVELAREADRATPLRRFPWLMALAFGLLHGFGFAGALAEAGLPSRDVPLALLAFNAGIELGQLAFVLVALAVARLVVRRAHAPLAPARTTVVYAMGILAAFWCLERVALLLA